MIPKIERKSWKKETLTVLDSVFTSTVKVQRNIFFEPLKKMKKM